MSERNGYFVVVEGNERTGKTTQLPLIEAELKARGYDVVVTREPGGTPFAETLRGLILDNSDNKNLDPVTELLLFTAARHDHYLKVVKPALDAGKVVLCSRGFFSTFALQVHPYGNEDLMSLFNHVTALSVGELGDIRPMMVNLTIDDATRDARFAERPIEDVIEGRGETYYAKVAEAYGLLESQPGTITKDGATEPKQLASEIVEELVVWFTEQDKRFEAAMTVEETPEATEAPGAAEQPTTESESDDTVDVEAIQVELNTELDRHAENLIEMVSEEDRYVMSVDWADQINLLRQWINIYIQEMSDKGRPLGREEAAHMVQKISDNLGALLGSWLTMRNIQTMVDKQAVTEA